LLLTFAIPVFNDSEALRQTLSSILAATDIAPGTVEIVVSDNHSEDDSFQVAQSLLVGVAHARAVRQDSNLGFSGNLSRLTQLARGEYIWFLAAGDFLVPDQLRYILNALLATKPDFGVVNGVFEYHQAWKTLPVSRSYSISGGKEVSSTPLFSHAVSLNIISRKVMTHYWDSNFSALENSRSNSGQATLTPKADLDDRHTHWPHLEAVCQTVIDNEPGSMRWLEYHGLSVLLGRNKNGDWDKRESALAVFSQWAEIIRLTHKALPASLWMAEMNRKLHGRHLLSFLFMLRKDETIGRFSLIKQSLALPIKLHVKSAAIVTVLLPKSTISFLVVSRRLLLKLASFWPAFNVRSSVN
jgi:glycosyltransferase involved in cell wall biosynthesis